MVINKVSDEYDDDAIVDLAGNALEVCLLQFGACVRLTDSKSATDGDPGQL